jgi:DNA replication protein DnaC
MSSATAIIDSGEIKICHVCGTAFVLPFPTTLASLVTVCPECCERQAREVTRAAIARSQAARRLEREQRWKALCPPEFQNTDPGRLPKPHLLAKVLAWQYGPQGLLLHGPTGEGKTRCVWLLLRRENQAGRKVLAISSKTLAVDYPALYAISCAEVKTWVDRLCEVEILLLDDPFKVKLTERVEEVIFTIIDQRTQKLLPILFTSNDTGTSIAGRLSPDRAAPLLRRLREHCQVICSEN